MKIHKSQPPNIPLIPHSTIPSRGFTLIEILLVVVIILIATGISVPLFRGTLKTAQMNSAVRATIRMARFARSMSIIKQDVCTLRLKDGLLTLSVGGPNSAEPEISRRLPDEIKISAFENLAKADKNLNEEHTVRYYPTGMNEGFKLTFSNEDNRRTKVSCNPLTGKTTVEENR